MPPFPCLKASEKDELFSLTKLFPFSFSSAVVVVVVFLCFVCLFVFSFPFQAIKALNFLLKYRYFLSLSRVGLAILIIPLLCIFFLIFISHYSLSAKKKIIVFLLIMRCINIL